jgi:hypothetical protein
MRNRYPVVILLLATPPALAEPPGDPWVQVPALPTSCYSAGDTFQDEAYAATEALQSEKTRQEGVNDTIAQQFRNVDVMELQQRMMTYMSEHPDEAQQVMLAMTQSGQELQEQLPEMAERSGQLESGLKDLTAKYEADLSAAIDPIEERRQALRSSKGWCSQESFARDAAFSREVNQAYDSVCARWWKEGGAFPGWLAEFKQHQIDYAVQQDGLDASATINYRIMGIEADQYRPTNDLDAAIEYLRRAGQVYSQRNHSPLSEEPITACLDHG